MRPNHVGLVLCACLVAASMTAATVTAAVPDVGMGLGAEGPEAPTTARLVDDAHRAVAHETGAATRAVQATVEEPTAAEAEANSFVDATRTCLNFFAKLPYRVAREAPAITQEVIGGVAWAGEELGGPAGDVIAQLAGDAGTLAGQAWGAAQDAAAQAWDQAVWAYNFVRDLLGV